jgi:hypothetical protein
MALTTPTAMAYRTDALADKAAALVAGVLAVAAVDCLRAVVASTRHAEHPSAARAKPCTHAWFILASGIW